MRTLGMPEPASAEFDSWFNLHAQSGYISFLASHPGYVLTGYYKDGLAAFASPLQPYFTTPEAPFREPLISLGELLHLSSPAPLLLDAILLLGLVWIAFRRRDPTSVAWAWLAAWLFLAAHIVMFINIFGDAYALVRHTLIATTMFRLFTWLFAIVLIELALQPEKLEFLASPGSNIPQS